MEKEKRYIAVEGPIGVGKTSLARMLALELDGELLLERTEDNPFLEISIRTGGDMPCKPSSFFSSPATNNKKISANWTFFKD